MNPSFDPGLTQKYTGALIRTINKDGSFNIRRRGFGRAAGDAYIHLIQTTWPRFLGIVAIGYLLVNGLFTGIYLWLGPGALQSSGRDLGIGRVAQAFFFSAQTLTTVGYGTLSPYGFPAHLISSLEVSLGLGSFALAASLMFARFSRPSARLVFSNRIIVAPYGDQTSLQFRVANQRSNVLMDVEADMMLMTVENGEDGKPRRKFVELALERRRIFFLALTWTVVHPIDQSSPLWKKTRQELEEMEAEVLILVKGFDDSFSQVLQTRYSYRWDEMEWSVRFEPAFVVSPAGQLVLDVGQIHKTTRVEGGL
ncbi:MAG TPA: ion channel [Bryobacteraceae bacterium]